MPAAAAPSLLQLVVSHWELANPSLDTMVPTILSAYAAALYLYGVTRVRRRASWPWRRTASFLAGLLVVLVALESGIDAYDDRLLSVHMVQHMLLLLVAPGLLLAGQPLLLLVRASPAGRRASAGRRLVRIGRRIHPLGCLAFLWVAILGTHLPAFYDLTLRDQAVHDTEHAVYLLAGLLVWWPLLDVDPAVGRRLSGFGRLAFAVAAMPPMALVGAYLDRNSTLVYAPYGFTSPALGVNPLADQAQAGAIMWVGGGTLLTVVGLWMAWRALAEEERRQVRRERQAKLEVLS